MTVTKRPDWWPWWEEHGGTGKVDALGRVISHPDDWTRFEWPPGWFPAKPKCVRCGDVGRYQSLHPDGSPLVNAHCDCEHGRFMSAAWYYEKHGYAPPPYTDSDFQREPDEAAMW